MTTHVTRQSVMTIEGVRDACTSELVQVCSGTTMIMGSSRRVLLALCETQCEIDPPLRTIAYLIANLLKQCLEVRSKYDRTFEADQHESAKKYNSEFTNISPESSPTVQAIPNIAAPPDMPTEPSSSTPTLPCSSWNSSPSMKSDDKLFATIGFFEAAITGDIFPGRPLLRKRVWFKNQSDGEWREECNKDYLYDASHSPGLFTSQRACVHSKLSGVSVSDEQLCSYSIAPTAEDNVLQRRM